MRGHEVWLLVDARTSLNHPAGTLPLDRVPSVRIPDGNLVRITATFEPSLCHGRLRFRGNGILRPRDKPPKWPRDVR